MSQQTLKDNLAYSDAEGSVIFNHYSFCELVKHIMIKYGQISNDEASEKLGNHFLLNVPSSIDHVYQLTHELEFHWAMLVVYGKMYWTMGIPSDFNDFREEYMTWEAETRRKYNLKKSYVYSDE